MNENDDAAIDRLVAEPPARPIVIPVDPQVLRLSLFLRVVFGCIAVAVLLAILSLSSALWYVVGQNRDLQRSRQCTTQNAADLSAAQVSWQLAQDTKDSRFSDFVLLLTDPSAQQPLDPSAFIAARARYLDARHEQDLARAALEEASDRRVNVLAICG